MDYFELFSINLKKSREEKQLTQKRLAELVGVSAQSISAYEKNEKHPQIEIAIKIATTLNLSLDQLFGIEPKQQFKFELKNLRDVVECLSIIAECVDCTESLSERVLTEDEYYEWAEAYRMGYEDTPPTTSKTAVFTLDSPAIARYIEAKQTLTTLYKQGTLPRETLDTALNGILTSLEKHYIHSFDEGGELPF